MSVAPDLGSVEAMTLAVPAAQRSRGGTVAEGPSGGPLGTITGLGGKSSDGFGATIEEKAKIARLERYELQAVLRSISALSPRIQTCLRYRHYRAETVDVYHSAVSGRAYYSGLMVCGLAAVCPNCGSRVGQHRRREIEEAISLWRGRGGMVGLLTLTLPHNRAQTLSDSLGALSAAYRGLRHDKGYRALVKGCGLAHTIKSVEVTHGTRNGWHPHLHILGFFAGDLDRSRFEGELARLWLAQLERVRPGLNAADVRKYGARFQLSFTRAHEYVTKVGRLWGLADELALANGKSGREGNASPPDLLRRVRDGDGQAEGLFREYGQTVAGVHLLQWSRGLRDALGLGAAESDEEVAAGVDQEDEMLGRITLSEWAAIRAAGHRAQVRLLEIAESGDDEAVQRYIAHLLARYVRPLSQCERLLRAVRQREAASV